MKKSNFILKPYFLFLTMVFLSLFVLSCNKEDLAVSSPAIPSYLQTIIDAHACLDTDLNGTLTIQSYRSIHTQDIERADIHGHFNGTQGAEDKGDLTIGSNLVITPDNLNNYSSSPSDNLSFLYGATTGIELKDGQTTYFNKNFVLPDMIKFISPTPTDNFVIDSLSSIVMWGSDANNAAGVAIIVEYLPDFPDNGVFESQGYDKIIVNTKLTDDSGSYQLLASDFNGIPNGAIITVRLARVGCDTITDENTGGKYFIYGYTMVDAMGKYMGGLL